MVSFKGSYSVSKLINKSFTPDYCEEMSSEPSSELFKVVVFYPVKLD